MSTTSPYACQASERNIERTLAWLSQNRRLSKDYERLAETVEALVYVAMSRLMARRLARS